MFFKEWINLLRHKFINLFRSPANEALWLDHRVKFLVNGYESWIFADTLEEIVWLPLSFNNGTSFHGMLSNQFM